MRDSDTSARYHRVRRPPDARHYGQNQSTTDIRSPFGGMPHKQAGQLGRFQINPMMQYLGMGPAAGSREAGRMDERLTNATGPMADALRAIRGFAPTVGPQAQQTGQRVADIGEAMFNRLQGQIGGALQQLPGLQAYSRSAASQASRGADLAARNAEQAFGPLANEDVYMTAARRMTDRVRPALASRGLASAGTGAAMETDALRELTADLAAAQREGRIGALGALQGSTQGAQAGAAQAAQLEAAGVPLAAAGLQAVDPLSQYMQAQYGMPMQALGGLLQMLQSGQAPALGLLQAVSPIATTESKGYNVL